MITVTDEQWPRERVAGILRDKIISGELAGKLPSRMTLAREMDVATGTIDAAVEILRGEGLITSRPGLGTFVRKPAG